VALRGTPFINCQGSYFHFQENDVTVTEKLWGRRELDQTHSLLPTNKLYPPPIKHSTVHMNKWKKWQDFTQQITSRPSLGPAFLLITVFSGKAHPVQLAHCNYDVDQATLGLHTLYQMRKLFSFCRIWEQLCCWMAMVEIWGELTAYRNVFLVLQFHDLDFPG
jgi:hypothetical protein